jgi:hypothetical protein
MQPREDREDGRSGMLASEASGLSVSAVEACLSSRITPYSGIVEALSNNVLLHGKSAGLLWSENKTYTGQLV